jgi:predicted PolB exonuclease-like 3'-5' exonuclease
MFDLPIVAFDIETLPDPALGRRQLGLAGRDDDVVAEMMRRRGEETSGRSEYPVQPWHRIVCVCATLVEPKHGRVQILSLGADDLMNEASHIDGFFKLVEDKTETLGVCPRLVSWNGSGFDLPILRYRAMLHGIVAGDFNRQDGDRKWNNYLGRFHDLHVDLMDLLCGFGAAPRVGLEATAQSLGLPSKSFLERPLHEHVTRGEYGSVVEYCKLDTLLTLLVYLAWGHHAGHLKPEQLRAILRGVRDALDGLDPAGWREVRAGLEGWPGWL